ncbi:MAG: hypothetical protein KME64_33285 [Scytonematopsis contorta HA4267-MV1]|jgi:hypothetical protein|nr:hypothetical protein [Scytonematopsis contorta HA4267-MV1]
MTQINYAAMTDEELKRYFLAHRDDNEAFYAYMDRRKSRPRRAVIRPDDPDWEEKLMAEVQAQLAEKEK